MNGRISETIWNSGIKIDRVNYSQHQIYQFTLSLSDLGVRCDVGIFKLTACA